MIEPIGPHRMPSARDVLAENIRAAGAALRMPLFAALAVTAAATLLLILEIVTDAKVMDFLPHQWILPGVLGFLLPVRVWKREDRFGAAFFWALPVDKQRHALIRVLSGWVWLMGLVATFVLGLLVLTLVSRGSILGERTLRFLPTHLNPVFAGRVDPVNVQSVRWTLHPLLCLVPFTAATATYLLASAAMVGATLRGIVKAALAFIVFIVVIATLGELMNAQWLILTPSRITRAVLYEPYGLATLLTATNEFFPIDTTLPTGETVLIGGGVPNLGRWAAATLIWTAAGLLALWATVRRQREHR